MGSGEVKLNNQTHMVTTPQLAKKDTIQSKIPKMSKKKKKVEMFKDYLWRRFVYSSGKNAHWALQIFLSSNCAIRQVCNYTFVSLCPQYDLGPNGD